MYAAPNVKTLCFTLSAKFLKTLSIDWPNSMARFVLPKRLSRVKIELTTVAFTKMLKFKCKKNPIGRYLLKKN